MRCARCGGLVIENWWDFVEDVSQTKLLGTKCVNCGAIEDSVILANRVWARLRCRQGAEGYQHRRQ